MRHLRRKKILNMPSAQRKAVIRNLAISFLKNGKTRTTLAKAKYLSSCVEKMITKAKKPSLQNTRLLTAQLNRECVPIIYDVAKKFSDKNGGYTRIIKTWQRYGDASKTAIIEFTF